MAVVIADAGPIEAVIEVLLGLPNVLPSGLQNAPNANIRILNGLPNECPSVSDYRNASGCRNASDPENVGRNELLSDRPSGVHHVRPNEARNAVLNARNVNDRNAVAIENAGLNALVIANAARNEAQIVNEAQNVAGTANVAVSVANEARIVKEARNEEMSGPEEVNGPEVVRSELNVAGQAENVRNAEETVAIVQVREIADLVLDANAIYALNRKICEFH